MLRTVVRTLLSYILLGICTIPFIIPTIIFLCLPARYRYGNKFLFGIANLFYRAVIKCSLLPITFLGKENLPEVPAIFVGNHQSSLDIPLMGVLAQGVPHIWLATSDLMRSPILRFILPRIAVLVDMKTPITAMRSLLKIINLTNGHKRHIMIFPEGGRYTDGNVHEFMGGFVLLAKKLARPVIPVYIHNVNKVYPPHSFWIYNYPVKVVVGRPFVYTEDMNDEVFKQRVYQWFVDQAREAS